MARSRRIRSSKVGTQESRSGVGRIATYDRVCHGDKYTPRIRNGRVFCAFSPLEGGLFFLRYRSFPCMKQCFEL